MPASVTLVLIALAAFLAAIWIVENSRNNRSSRIRQNLAQATAEPKFSQDDHDAAMALLDTID